jgi:hypothetical protein
MTIHFIGAGPGAADLITIRGRDIIRRCRVCLYAGSVISSDLLTHCDANTRLVDTAKLSLDQITTEYKRAHAQGFDVARLHSGDLSIWSAIAEQIRHSHTRCPILCCGSCNSSTGTYFAGRHPISRASAPGGTSNSGPTQRKSREICGDRCYVGDTFVSTPT